MNLAIRKAIDFFGSQRQLADAIGCHKNSVNNWINGRYAPTAMHVMAIMSLTEGVVKFSDFSKRINREDFEEMHRIWRESE